MLARSQTMSGIFARATQLGGLMNQSVRVRFAPSPTGYLHIGGVRTAIYNYLFARRHQGVFILRIEDTDRQRSTREAVRQILDSLEWLDLKPDEGPILQSDRLSIYQEHIDTLLKRNSAYRCYCAPELLEKKRQQAISEKRTYKYDGTCRKRDPNEDPGERPYTVRFRMPDQHPDHFNDLIMGAIPIDGERLDDWILVRSDGTPTYNFSVVVDDACMRITHIIRGNDHVANTPSQIMLYRAFDYPVPQFAHMPLTHGPDGSKLSKRREEEYRKLGISVSVQEYRKMGYLPQALVNYLTRLGWSHKDQEIFSREELQTKFDLEHVGKSPGVLDPAKLKWINATYIKQTSDQDLANLLVAHLSDHGIRVEANERLCRIAASLKIRSETIVEMAQKSLFYFHAPTEYDPNSIKKWWKPGAKEILTKIREDIPSLDFTREASIEKALESLASELTEGKLGKIAQPLRLALTGTTVSPSIFEVMSILGIEETTKRLERAEQYLAQRD